MNKRPHFLWNVTHRDRNGRVLWEGLAMPNLLHDEGEQYILQTSFSEEQTVPVNFFIGLDARVALAEADNLAALSGEPSTNGYAREAVPSTNVGFVVTQDAGDYQAKSQTVTFNATGGAWGPVDNMFLATSSDATGKLIASVALSAQRTLQDGDSLDVDITIKLAE